MLLVLHILLLIYDPNLKNCLARITIKIVMDPFAVGFNLLRVARKLRDLIHRERENMGRNMLRENTSVLLAQSQIHATATWAPEMGSL